MEKMLAEADAYAAANKEDYVQIIDRYHVVQGKAEGTARAEVVERKLNLAVDAHEQAATDTIGKLEAKARELLRMGKVPEAYNIWKEFPARLRTPETDQQIRQLLERLLPPDFEPE